MTSKEIYSFVEKETGLDLKRKTRAREYVETRAVANALAKKYTDESYSRIGRNTNCDHATVYYSIRQFRDVYRKYSETAAALYDRLDIFFSGEDPESKKIIRNEMLVHQIINLRQENRRLRFKLKELAEV